MAEDEYRDLFVAEAIDMMEGLNIALTELETNPNNSNKIDEIFRLMHTLKGNAMGMGYTGIGEMAHVIEDLFGEIKKNNTLLSKELIEHLFRGMDKLSELIDALSSGESVSYKGLRTKLQVYHQKLLSQAEQPAAPAAPVAPAPAATVNTEVNAEKEVTEKVDEVASESADESQEVAVEPAGNTPAEEVEEVAEVEESTSAESKEWSIKDIANQFTLDANGNPVEKQSAPISEEPKVVEPENEKVEEVAPVAQEEQSTPVEVEEVEAEEEPAEIEHTQKSKISFSETIQVPTSKVDDLMNLIGELLIERDTVSANLSNHGESFTSFDRLNRIVSDLQYGIMNIRLVKVGFLFNKFTRIVRDVANIESKDVELRVEGAEIEIDRNVLKTISDAMIHIVRNAVSHGIEPNEKRESKGKPRKGRVTLNALNENDNVIIQVSDDGNGIDHTKILKKAIQKGLIDEQTAKVLTRDEILMYIFEPGFSNAEVVNEVSGRGVGMDVVKRTVESIGGRVQIETEVGKGSTISLHLPSSLAVKGALLFELDKQEFAVTINYTEAVLSLTKKDFHRLPQGCLTEYLGNPISIVFLSELYNNDQRPRLDEIDDDKKLDVIVIRYQNRLFGIVVDKLLLQQEIVEKQLKGILTENTLFKTATILGNGNVCLILDVPSVFKLVQDKSKMLRKVA